MWSHHEKICVIDQRIGFLGGLDICMGRWDTQKHPLTDVSNAQGLYYFPGMDYSNSRTYDFREVHEYRRELIDRDSQPRMPWHDVSVCIHGEAAKDLARHFIE